VIHRVFELGNKISIFLRDSNNNDDANIFYNEDLIQKLVCLVDIFEKLI
jgi:hypothetical protein